MAGVYILQRQLHFVNLMHLECSLYIKPLSSGVVNLVFPLQTGFFDCKHPFIDKPMTINEPAVANARLLGLVPKLYHTPSKVLLDSCKGFLKYAKREQVKEMLCRGRMVIDTDEVPGFFLLLKNHIFIARSEDTIFIFHV